jgi:hypothetical protein
MSQAVTLVQAGHPPSPGFGVYLDVCLDLSTLPVHGWTRVCQDDEMNCGQMIMAAFAGVAANRISFDNGCHNQTCDTYPA